MPKRLRVGNMGFAVDMDRFKAIFGQFGTVVGAEIMSSPLSGKSRGFGFIEMSSVEEAAQCIEQLDGKDRDGLKLVVSAAPIEKKTRQKRSYK
jgi:RNA recognition motif-containing protein